MKRKFILKEQTGAAALEFAIMLPILLLIVFGIIEFSLIMFDQAMITNASREGARAGIAFNSNPDEDSLTGEEIAAVVRNYLGERLINLGGISGASIVTTGAQGTEGSPLTVTVDYQYGFLILPSFANSLTGGVNLSARTVMRME